MLERIFILLQLIIAFLNIYFSCKEIFGKGMNDAKERSFIIGLSSVIVAFLYTQTKQLGGIAIFVSILGGVLVFIISTEILISEHKGIIKKK